MYHSGIEVGGVEYTFSEMGIAQHSPRQVPAEGCTYKTTEVRGVQSYLWITLLKREGTSGPISTEVLVT